MTWFGFFFVVVFWFFFSDRHLRSLLGKITYRAKLAFKWFLRLRSRDEKPYRASWLLLRSIRSSVYSEVSFGFFRGFWSSDRVGVGRVI